MNNNYASYFYNELKPRTLLDEELFSLHRAESINTNYWDFKDYNWQYSPNMLEDNLKRLDWMR